MITLRESLAQWASRTFGDCAADDVYNLKDEVTLDKTGRRVSNITLFVKKHRDFQEAWAKIETFSKWIEELKAMIGDAHIIRIMSAEGKELRFVSYKTRNKDGELLPQENVGDVFSYQFSLAIVKPLDKETKNEQPKPDEMGSLPVPD